MPTYEYQCTQCAERLEAVQSFNDEALKECPSCGEPTLRKLFGNVGVVFKGSGFYRNDARDEHREKSKNSEQSQSSTKDADSGADSSKSGSTSDSNTKPDATAGSGEKAGSGKQDSTATNSGVAKKTNSSKVGTRPKK
jgi:putative FmdB family regulatory protein